MVEKDPRVTLQDEARGIDAAPGSSAFLDWLWEFALIGDDGKRYWFGGSPLILKLENIDLANWELVTEEGRVFQDPKSIYKIADFPGIDRKSQVHFDGGTHRVQQLDDRVVVDLGVIHVECHADNSWRIVVDDPEQNFKADMIHRPDCGGPLWYGREKPSYLTQHSVTYGYNWCGQAEGTLTIDGREIRVKGAGIRERYVATDSSSAEIGGWEDWGWVHFDEVYGSMYDMRLGMKDFALNLVDEDIYLPEGDMTITHQEWAYMPKFGGFVPTEYVVKMETAEGVLDFTAHVNTGRSWSVTDKVPDNPVCTLMWDKVEGTFTFKDGSVKQLTNGFGGMSIRQWRAYPNVMPIGLGGGDTALDTGARFTTL